MTLTEITRREFNQLASAAGLGLLLGNFFPNTAHAQIDSFDEIAGALRGYLYSSYDERNGEGTVSQKTKKHLRETLKKYGFKKEAQIILNGKSEPVPRLSGWFEKRGHNFSNADPLFESVGYDLRKVQKVEQEERELFGKKKKFYLLTCETPEIATYIDREKLKEKKRLARISRTTDKYQVEWVPQSHAQLERVWYRAYEDIEGLRSAAKVSLDEHVTSSGGNNEFFRVLGSKLYLLAAGKDFEKTKSETEFVKQRLKAWRESVAVRGAMQANDWFALPQSASKKLQHQAAMHYESRSMLAEMHNANPHHALWNCIRYRNGPVEYAENDFDYREHAAKVLLDGLSQHIVDNRDHFPEVSFEDFDRTKKTDDVIKHVHKVSKEKLKSAAKAVFDNLYKGKPLKKWIKGR